MIQRSSAPLVASTFAPATGREVGRNCHDKRSARGNPTADGGNGTNPAGQGGCGCDTSGSPPYSAGLALAAFALLFGRKGRRKTK
jgi:MYXO-CTERM domain-containing protein